MSCRHPGSDVDRLAADHVAVEAGVACVEARADGLVRVRESDGTFYPPIVICLLRATHQCRSCGAYLCDGHTPDDPAMATHWTCGGCGMEHPKNETRCRECGGQRKDPTP